MSSARRRQALDISVRLWLCRQKRCLMLVTHVRSGAETDSLEEETFSLMKNSRPALWLLLASQLIFLLSSLIEPPQTLVTMIVRVVVPLILVAYICLMLAGYVLPGKRWKE